MQVSDKLSELYDGYYDSDVAKKRAIAAAQTIAHIQELLPQRKFHDVVDIGAGEGAVLAELDRTALGENLHALEISPSGIEAIKRRGISSLRSVEAFDGYRIPAADGAFDLGLAIHVLEHVEHERGFIAEVLRTCRIAYIEVPLEHTLRIERSIRSSGPYGHINFYTPSTFRNILLTAGARIQEFRTFSNSAAYEVFVGGKLAGRMKHSIRSLALRAAPQLAPYVMTYLAGAVVTASSSNALAHPAQCGSGIS